MDYSLAGLEPQLAIPVILVVLGAILVYMFGFKQTEEPSYEHLAVLQSSSSFHKTRSAPSNNPKQQNNKTANGSVNKGQPKANGHLPSATANGSVPKKAVSVTVNKENKPPTVVKGGQQQIKKNNAKDPANKPEDFESGDWIPAVSRKEKTKKKEAPFSPGKRSGPNNNKGNNGETVAEVAPTVKAPKIEDLLAEMNVLKEIERQNHSTQTSPDKKKKVVTPPAPAKAEKVAKVPAPPAPTPQKVEEEEEVVTPPAQEKKAAAPTPKKSNIAFDEMGGGDSWEEAKSRGAKKRTRARKD